MRVALIAPLVAPIREPQRGGSQAFICDLARGLIGRGAEVTLYAASGSDVPGVTVADVGVDPRALSSSLYRASGGGTADSTATDDAFAAVYSAVRESPYDVIHNHAFDAPAISLATALPAPVVHTLHLPPDDAVSAALEGDHGGPACLRLRGDHAERLIPAGRAENDGGSRHRLPESRSRHGPMKADARIITS